MIRYLKVTSDIDIERQSSSIGVSVSLYICKQIFGDIMAKKIVVIGAGAAGMMAAITAGKTADVLLIEKNDRVGKKLFITGKGRCNVTNAGDADVFFNSVVTNSKFMYSSFYSFDNNMVMDFLEKASCPLKVERGGRVFPVSDHSSDVIGAFKTLINRNHNIKLLTDSKVLQIKCEDDRVTGVVIQDKENKKNREIDCDAVIVATGGMSYPLTGSTGDGYRWAEKCGHTIKELSPSLVPFEIEEKCCRDMMGLSLKNVSLHIKCGKKKIFDEQGEMLFTHFGISGPLVIKASAYIHRYIGKEIELYIDLKPAMDEQVLDTRIQKDFAKYVNKDFRNSLTDILPVKLIQPVIEKTGIDPFKKVNSVTKEERLALVHVLKHFDLTFVGLRDYNEAIITKGGVNVKEVDPSTMESKIVKNLYFAGEILDLDALTGGFNLQIAWSTGYLAGLSAAESIE